MRKIFILFNTIENICGDRWTKANGDEVFSTYGDSSYMWEYY